MDIEIDLKLHEECWCCNGGRRKPVKAYTAADGTCEMCKGGAYTPTDLGRQTLAFLRRHLKPECFIAPADSE